MSSIASLSNGEESYDNVEATITLYGDLIPGLVTALLSDGSCTIYFLMFIDIVISDEDSGTCLAYRTCYSILEDLPCARGVLRQ